MRRHSRQHGFTLVEAIAVIVIAGIIAAMVAMFIRSPIDAYVDTARRAMLADVADTAARRIARELQGALPNSVRAGDPHFLEFVPIVTAGRYRAEAGTASTDDPLIFTGAADTGFDVLGPAVTVPAGSSVVIYNLGIAGANVYETSSAVRRAAVAGNNLSKVTFTGAPFTFPSPGSRFQIVGTPVSYACDLASGTLWRYAGYAFQPGQPMNLPALEALAGGSRAALATHLTGCRFDYGAGPLQHSGLVSMILAFAQDGETVTLQHQVNVDNVP
jgi:MSHA biogenesis protein MshO